MASTRATKRAASTGCCPAPQARSELQNPRLMQKEQDEDRQADPLNGRDSRPRTPAASQADAVLRDTRDRILGGRRLADAGDY